MTVAVDLPRTDGSQPEPRRSRRRMAAIVTAAAVLAVGAGICIGVAVSDGGSSAGTTNPAVVASYPYYQSVMGRYGTGTGSMMGGSSVAAMMGRSGYTWMMGATAAPGWMTGGNFPGYMMGTSRDAGQVMGRLFADAPGPRVTPADAATLGKQIPSTATVDRRANRVVFTGRTVHLTVLASPAGGPDEKFRVAGLVDPTIAVPKGARVVMQLINADNDTAHGLVITGSGSTPLRMPMMTTSPVFPGSAVWFLGDPTSAGMHTATLTFTTASPGTYRYLCPVPGHAQKGMIGDLVVSG